MKTHRLPLLYSILTALSLVLPVNLGWSQGGTDMGPETEPAIASELAVRVAESEAEAMWPGCQYLSVVPYHDLEGNVTAWAVQFAKPGSKVESEKDILPLMADRLSTKERVYAETEIPTCPPLTDVPFDPRDLETSEVVPELVPITSVIQVPADAMAVARQRMEEESFAMETANARRAAAEAKRLDAIRSANLADDIGTVVISAREDLYPVIEAHSGPAANLKFTEEMAAAARIQKDALGATPLVEKVYYLGPMTYWLQPTATARKSTGAPASQWFDVTNSEWIDGVAKKSGVGATGMKPVFDKELGVSPQDVWASIRKAAKDAGTKRLAAPKADMENKIEGVPFYFQSRYGRNSCGPTTFATILGYFDTQGWGTLVDNGISLHIGPGNESHLIYYCMRDTGYHPDTGTWPDWDPIESGIRKVCEDTKYANFVDAHINEETDVSYGNDLVDYVDKNRPVAYCWYIDNADAFTGHWSTVVGYRKTGNSRYITLHNNWERDYPDGIVVNTSNVYDANEWCEKIRIDEEPFDTPWSESWETCSIEGTDCRGAWLTFCRINGVQQHYVGWMANILRSHSRPYSPYPEWGGSATSGKLTPPSLKAEDPYPPNFDSYFLYGPFSTMGRTWGELSTMMVQEIADWQDDGVMLVGSIDGVNFGGFRIAGNAGGGDWFNARLDMTNVPGVGSLMNQPKVWVGFYFHSDGDANSSRGPFIDNINIITRPRVAPLPKPTNVQASQGLYTGKIEISCPPVSGATHYQFLRYYVETNSYEPISGWIETPLCSDYKATAGNVFHYRAKCADNPSGTNASEISDRADGWLGTRPPYNFNASRGNYVNRVDLVWWDADNSEFSIERSSAGENGPWSTVKPFTSKGSFLYDPAQPHLFVWSDMNVVLATDYHYRVRGRKGPTTTAYTETQLGYTRMPNVTGITATPTATGVTLTWNGTPGRYYSIYHSNSSTGVPVRIRDLALTLNHTHTITTEPGVYHYYWVRQALDASSKAISDYGSYATGYKLNQKPTNLEASDGDSSNHVFIRWDSMPGATHYQLRSTTEGVVGEQLHMNWSETISFTDTAASPGKTKTYRVYAASSSTGFAASVASDSDTGWRALAYVSNIQATDGTRTDGIQITWNAVAGAGAYRVSRYTSESSLGVIVSGWITAHTFVDRTAIANVIYRYRVQPAVDIQGNRPGLTPNSDTGYRGFGPPTGLVAADGDSTEAVPVTWDDIPGNVLYQVYRANSEFGLYTPLSGWLNTNQYDDTSAMPGTTYWYAAKAATNAAGTNETALSSLDSGWRKLRAPQWIDATDGEDDTIAISWEEPAEAEFFDVFYSATPFGLRTLAAGRVKGGTTTHVPPEPGTIYYYSVQAFVDPDTAPQHRSGFSPSDSGWYVAEKLNHPPNCTDAYGVASYIDGLQVQQAEVSDDWTCPDGNPIRTIRWWGNYRGYASDTTSQVAPPSKDKVQEFVLRMYALDDSGPIPVPGTLLHEVRVGNFTETWNCAVPRIDDSRLREHQFVYEATLDETWAQNQGTTYYLAIVANMAAINPTMPWAWQSANTHTGTAAYYRSDFGLFELSYPQAHPLAGQPMSMSFVLDSEPVVEPTPTPTTTPTPSPTPTPGTQPGGKWSQQPNLIDGNAVLSYTEVPPASNDVEAADDWVCLDGKPILRVRWWGGYPGWETSNPALLPPPAGGPTAFILTWYTAIGQQVNEPGAVIAQETVSGFDETAVGSVLAHLGPQIYEYQHVYQYDVTLATPWAQTKDQSYFLSIQAVYPTQDHTTNWGWFPAETKQFAPGYQIWDPADGWAPIYYESYHRLFPGRVDLAFELYTDAPTPTPSPSISPTLPPSPTPTATMTATASPTATPVGMRFDHAPNLLDSITRPSWMTSGKGLIRATTPVSVADDWQTIDDRPIDRVRWWGAYAGLGSGSAAQVIPPAGRPAEFELTWSEVALGPPFQPGTPLATVRSSDFTETWVMAVERWDAPGTYIHVFQYEMNLPDLWWAFPSQDYFLEVRAVYPAAPTQNEWGWIAATETLGHAGVEKIGSGSWTELFWPSGHRLDATPMDLAFQMIAVDALPTETPTPTPAIIPTDTPTPTPTPFGWTGSQPPNTIDGIDSLSISEQDGAFDTIVADDVTFDHDVTINTLIWWGSYPGWRSSTNSAGNSPASLDGLIGNLDRPKERPAAYAIRLYEPAPTGMGEPGTLLLEQFVNGWTEDWSAAVPRFGHAGQWEHEYVYTAPLEMPLMLAANTRYFLSVQAMYADPDPAYFWGWLASSEQHNASAFTRTGAGLWTPMEWPAGHRLGTQAMDMAFELREGLLPTPTFTPTPTATPVTTPSQTPAGWYALNINAANGTVGRNPDQAAYAPGATVELVAKGEDGYTFSAWSGDVTAGQQGENPLFVTMSAPRTLTASFEQVLYAITTTADSGTVTVAPQQTKYVYGTMVTVEAHPGTDQFFKRWEMTGGEFNETELRQNPLQFAIRENVTLRAITGASTDTWVLF